MFPDKITMPVVGYPTIIYRCSNCLYETQDEDNIQEHVAIDHQNQGNDQYIDRFNENVRIE